MGVSQYFRVWRRKRNPAQRSDGEAGGLNMMKSKNQLQGFGRMAVIAPDLNESCLGAALGMQAWVKWAERTWE